jgi:cytochrome c oxidase assembly protein subunit 11
LTELKPRRRIRRLAFILCMAAVLMFGFAYLMVPFYNVMCKALGINGKPNLVPVAQSQDLDSSRLLTMQFVTSVNANLSNVDFYSKTHEVQLHPGENQTILYVVKNNNDHDIIVQAIPSVTPGLAAQYVKKTECFCFTQQFVKAHETKIMPLLFHIDKSVAADINTLTLSYTLFAAKQK